MGIRGFILPIVKESKKSVGGLYKYFLDPLYELCCVA